MELRKEKWFGKTIVGLRRFFLFNLNVKKKKKGFGVDSSNSYHVTVKIIHFKE